MHLKNIPAQVVKIRKYLYFRLKRAFLVRLVRFVDKILRIKIPPISSSTAIIEKDGKIIVNKLTYENGYGLPGGTLQKNEDFETAVKREVEEETGLKITDLEYFGSYWYNIDFPSVNITYLAKASGKLHSSKEGRPEWVSIEDVVEKMAFPDNKQALRDYLKEKTK